MTVLSVDGRALSKTGPVALPSAVSREVEVRASGGEPLLVELKDQDISEGATKLSLWLLGGMFAVLGSAVLLRRPDLSAARWFAVFVGFAAAALAVGPAAGGPHPQWALVVQVMTLVGIGATCLPFAIALVATQDETRWPIVFTAVIIVGSVLAAGYAVSVLAAPAWYEFVRPTISLYVATSLLGAVVVLAITASRQRSPARRQQGRIALFGIGLGTLPFIALSLIPRAITSDHPLVPAHLTVLAVGLIPVAFAYAILYHNLLGIRRLVHRGVVYGLTSLTTLAIVAVGLSVATSLVAEASNDNIPLLLTAMLLTGGVALFFPLRRGARRLVDKLLYSDTVRYETFVDVIRGDLRSSDRTNDVITGIARRLIDALQLESAVLFLGRDQSDLRMVTAEGPRAGDVVRTLYPHLESSIQDSGDSDLMDLRWESDSLLLMNLRVSGRRIGYALLGPKLDGEVFVDDEKRLVATVAPLLALAVDQSILSGELLRAEPTSGESPGDRAGPSGSRHS
jgi:MFS family permease